MSVRPPAVFTNLQKQYLAYSQVRREVIVRSQEALAQSKKAIFAYHRDDEEAAQVCLARATTLFQQAELAMKKNPSLLYEGAYRAALEEYAEALLFAGYLHTGKMDKIDARAMDPQIYLAGLSDATGEIVRYTLRQVTQGNNTQVVHARDTVEMIIEFMLELDATGYLRTKFDQAKGNLKRLEEILYDLSLR